MSIIFHVRLRNDNETATKGYDFLARYTKKRGPWRVTESAILSRDEIRTVIDALNARSRRSVNARQARVIFCLATFCGLRVSEICGLRMHNLPAAIARPVIQIPAACAKGHKAREIPLWRLPQALAILAAWKAERTSQGATERDHLVCAQSKAARGRKLDRRNARARFISACRPLGAERQRMLTIHSGRHTCASHLLAAGWPLPAVRDMLGHSNISTTSIYSHIVVDDEQPPDPFAFTAQHGLNEVSHGSDQVP